MQDSKDNTKIQQGLQDINQAFKERDIQAKAKVLGISYVNLLTMPLNPDLAILIDKETAEKAQAALFFKSGKQLRLAVIDPHSPQTQELTSRLKSQGYEVLLSLCSEESMNAGHRIYFTDKYKRTEKKETVVEDKKLGSLEEEISDLEKLKEKIEGSSYDIALNIIQIGAYKTRATDIHFQPEERHVLVRFRIDGVLRPIFYITREIYEGLLKEIKQLSHLKLNVNNIPQEGQYSFKANDRDINIRVSLLPTQYGEACVLRLLDPEKAFISFEELGYEGEALKYLKEAAQLPHGLILVTGPSGSGKTTTMYALLKTIDTQSKKIVTLEDPVEYRLESITQSQINPELGYTFSAGLKAVLRQDPNVIMVGEIRDLETAETAAQASLTGHLVISTLHTNSAIESIPRLTNMGVKNFILAPAFDLIVAQRLVRRICHNCAQDRELTPAEKEHLEFILAGIKAKGITVPVLPASIKQAIGCEKCAKTGYFGQIAIAEVLKFNQELRDLILKSSSMPEIYDYISKKCKMLSLHEDGALKIINGVTTLEEVYRVSV